MSTRLLFLFFSLITVEASELPYGVVRTPDGLVAGSQIIFEEHTYTAFYGVPYARPPVGKYRFREPQPVKPWAGIWNATHFAPHCLQYDPFEKQITGSEDCLYLNVYTFAPITGPTQPVVVFIHGGAFMYGGSSFYGPHNLIERNVLVVTLNYRLGPLGFLSTGDEVIPGNAGLKDQAFALKWVRKNIKYFGGDPNSITLTGCSAGGASVHYHYLSPLSKGNFDRGIAFSGSAFASWTYAYNPAKKAKSLAAIVGCPTNSSRDLADCLMYRPAETIVRAQIEMFDWKVHMFTPFTPTVEAPGVRHPFLSQYPYKMAIAGEMHKLPLITSVTSEEGLYPAAAYQADPDILPDLASRFDELVSNIFEFNDTLPLIHRKKVALMIKQRYLKKQPISQETFGKLVQALGDRLFVAEVGRLAKIHAVRSGQPVYVYRYSFRGEKSLSNLMAKNDNNYGVSHADDIFHIFKYPGLVSDKLEDTKMTEILLNLVCSFATDGIPKVRYGFNWTPVDPMSPEMSYLEIASPKVLEMRGSSDFGNRTFWDSLGFLENNNYGVSIRDEL